jgi:8-oxo-dGTP pyrophosphatase MutT (NUDIX family)
MGAREAAMPMSDYLRELREKVGHDLLVLPSVAVALMDSERRVLLGLHSDRNLWVLPGGLVEPAELPADAAIRELWEETGLRAELTGVIGVYGGPDLIVNYANGDRASYVSTVFRGRVVGGKLQPDGAEILDLRYFSLQELKITPHPRWMTMVMRAVYGLPGPADFQAPSFHPD